jgi:hypothetical protein
VSSIILRNPDSTIKENESLISSIRLTILWPHLEVLDLSYNKLNDFYEVMHLINGGIVRRDLVKTISIKGNQFYNFYQIPLQEHKIVNDELEPI